MSRTVRPECMRAETVDSGGTTAQVLSEARLSHSITHIHVGLFGDYHKHIVGLGIIV